jgi:hypothetical protein
MKFVCTECDEPMKFDQNGGLDEDGSMSATFRCPSCEWGVTLLINPQETQMVRSLGVKIGGATVPAQPMEMLQTHLANPSGGATETLQTSGASCPFSAMVQDAFNTTPGALQWSVEAEQRLERAPSFVRAMVRRGIEDFAREQGYAEITPQVMDEARARMGM